MKKNFFILIIILQISCSKDDTDCRLEKLEIYQQFDRLLEAAGNDVGNKAALIQQRDDRIKLLDC